MQILKNNTSRLKNYTIHMHLLLILPLFEMYYDNTVHLLAVHLSAPTTYNYTSTAVQCNSTGVAASPDDHVI